MIIYIALIFIIIGLYTTFKLKKFTLGCFFISLGLLAILPFFWTEYPVVVVSCFVPAFGIYLALLELLKTKDKQKERPNTETTQAKSRYVALLVAGIPLPLGLWLFAIGHVYMGRINPFVCEPMWIDPDHCSHPSLLVIILIIFAFVSIAHVGLRGSFAFLGEKWRQITLICIFALLIFPAYFLALLGPIALVFVETGFRQ